MNGDDHVRGLGKIIANLQSLEISLRVFLCNANKEYFLFPNAETVSMPENHLTNRDLLGTLVRKYNASLSAAERREFEVDTRLIDVRDAIAHGRLGSPVVGFPLTFHKFGKPDKKTASVPVEANTLITCEWFKTNVNLALEQMEKVAGCAKARGYHFETIDA